MPFLTTFVRADITQATARMCEPLIYEGRDDTFTVPAGFATDFASVPQAVTWLIPKMGTYSLGAVLHDYLCTELETAKRARWFWYHQPRAGGIVRLPYTPRDVDGIFRRVMREAGVPAVRRWLMWTGVRWGALFTPSRRPGWLRDAPAVLGISLLALPVIAPATMLAAVTLAVDAAVEATVGRWVR